MSVDPHDGETPTRTSSSTLPIVSTRDEISVNLESIERIEKDDDTRSSNFDFYEEPVNLEDVLQMMGEFGRHQIYTYLILSMPVIFVSMTMFSYIFTAGDLNYRCRIPECGDNGTQYMPEWWQIAAPVEQRAGENVPSRCLRYQTTDDSVSEDSCPAEIFLNSTVRCDDWVFDGDEFTIVREWGILCDDNQWKLTLVGTMNSLGQFVGLPIAGLLSDRFGRRIVLLTMTFVACLVGIGRSFSSSYVTFVVLEFVNMIVSGNVVFASAFVLGVEQLGSNRRVLGSTILFMLISGGEMLIGLMAWWIHDWRTQIRIMYGLGMMLLTYIWLVPESTRWLLVKGRIEEAKHLLRQAASTNRVILPEDVLKRLELSAAEKRESEKTLNVSTASNAFFQVIKSRTLLLRIMNCSFCWATNAFVYYGLSLNSVSLAGNKYLNFILVSCVEIPGNILYYFIMVSGLGRKMSLSSTLMFSGMCCIAFIFVPADMTWLSTAIFLVGKFSVTMSFGVIYVITTEMLPTTLRHTLFGFCSMIGRIGTLLAPQTPLLAQYMESLPLILFGSLALLSGMLALFFPETMGTKLPDTVEEAEHIGSLVRETSQARNDLSSIPVGTFFSRDVVYSTSRHAGGDRVFREDL